MKKIKQIKKNEAEIETGVFFEGYATYIHTVFVGENEATILIPERGSISDFLDMDSIPGGLRTHTHTVKFESESAARDGHAWIVENIKAPENKHVAKENL